MSVAAQLAGLVGLVGLSALGVGVSAPALLIPTQGAYNGAYGDFGSNEDRVTFEAIEDFATLVGKRQAIIAFGNNWGRGRFPSEQVHIIHNVGAVPLILWYPRETSDEIPKTQFDLDSISAGRWDPYLDAWGQAAKAAGGPILVSWGLEMNGDWYPWSGIDHGGGTPIPGSHPPRYQGPDAYQKAYRHVVDRVRAMGADNIAWVFHVNSISFPPEPWNAIAQYYPGQDYADWIGMSAYGKQFPDPSWAPVDEALTKPYAELAAVDPSKPIIVAEWGVGEFPQQGSKAEWIREAMSAMRQMPRLKGAVFWHERWQNPDLSYSNLRVNSSLEALTAYRTAIADPFWLDRPQLSEALPALGKAVENGR